MTRASVAVIGAGVVGASVAYHLARRGWRDVLLLDRASGPGLGSTGAATGGFRAQFASDANVRLSLLARERLSAFKQETGVDPGLVAAGYLWLARRAQDLEALRAALAVQKRNGFRDAREIDAREAVALNPAMNPDGILGGTFAGSDGFLRPLAILEGYLRAAEELGVTVRWNAEVTGLRRGEGAIEAVRVGADWIHLEAVVNAAGAWAGPVAGARGRRCAGHAPEAPGPGERAVRRSSRDHADDHLGRRRLSTRVSAMGACSRSCRRPAIPTIRRARASIPRGLRA
jgi:sarcosine oxidase subunit beta